MSEWLVKAIAAALGLIVEKISDEMRDYLRRAVLDFQAKAKTTDNPWDDLLANVLVAIVGAK